MLPGRRDKDGRAFITTAAPGTGTTFQGGIAISPLGQLHVVDAAPEFFTNGFGVLGTGQLCVAPGGSSASYLEGIPRSDDGRVVTHVDGAIYDTDTFLGGLRIGSIMGPVPVMSLNFLNDGPLDPRITFTRTGGGGFGATRVNSAGLIESKTTNQPRFDFDPVTPTRRQFG